MENNQFTNTEIKAMLTCMVSMKDILEQAGYSVRVAGSMYCPFHPNYDSPAAKYYTGTNNMFCFSEHRLYNIVDALSLAGIDYRTYFYDLWNNYTDEQKQLVNKKLAETPVFEPRLLFRSALNEFKNGKITYQQLCEDIVSKSTEANQEILSTLYAISRDINAAYINSDDYTYLTMLAGLNNIKHITSGEIIDKDLKRYNYIANFINKHKDIILIFNMYKDTPIGCTLRSQNSHDFIDVGNTGGMFYNLCNMNPNFKYGDTIILVEGPKDCEMYKAAFKDPNCLAMMTSTTTSAQLEVLKALTNNIILANDNDSAGQEAQKQFISQNKRQFKINIITHPDELKDFGDLIPLLRTNKEKAKQLVTRYNIQINTFV